MARTKQATIQEMVDSLVDKARLEDVSLKGLNKKNFNSFLDDAFNDGGQVRCEYFGDLAMEYALRFGKLESTPFTNAQWECIEAALDEIERRVTKGEVP